MKDGNLCLIWGRVACNGWIYKGFQTIGNKCSQHNIWQSLRADIFAKFVLMPVMIVLRARERIQPNIIVRNTLESKSLTNSYIYLRP